jgi:hypothetical protein
MLEAWDRLYRILKNEPNKPFGGANLIISGDWRQQLPVIKNAANDAHIVGCTLLASPLWSLFNVFHLEENMRLRANNSSEAGLQLREYGEWLLKIGAGNVPVSHFGSGPQTIDLPRQLCLNGDDFDAAIEWVYPNLQNQTGDSSFFDDRRIFAPYHTVNY